jgi:hypothetical protein
MLALKKEVYGDDYVDSEPEEPGSPELQSPIISRSKTIKAPKEDDIKDLFNKLFQ